MPLLRPDEADAAREDHGDAIAEHRQRAAQAALGGCQQIGAISIDHHILRGGKKGHPQRHPGEGQRCGFRVGAGHSPENRRQQELREHQPAAPSAQDGRLEAVQQRRPEELEGVRHPHQAQEADGGDIHALHAQPRLHGLAGQRQGQAGSEAEKEDGEKSMKGGELHFCSGEKGSRARLRRSFGKNEGFRRVQLGDPGISAVHVRGFIHRQAGHILAGEAEVDVPGVDRAVGRRVLGEVEQHRGALRGSIVIHA